MFHISTDSGVVTAWLEGSSGFSGLAATCKHLGLSVVYNLGSASRVSRIIHTLQCNLTCTLCSPLSTRSRWRSGLARLQQWPCYLQGPRFESHLRPVEFFVCNKVSSHKQLSPNANICAMRPNYLA